MIAVGENSFGFFSTDVRVFQKVEVQKAVLLFQIYMLIINYTHFYSVLNDRRYRWYSVDNHWTATIIIHALVAYLRALGGGMHQNCSFLPCVTPSPPLPLCSGGRPPPHFLKQRRRVAASGGSYKSQGSCTWSPRSYGGQKPSLPVFS